MFPLNNSFHSLHFFQERFRLIDNNNEKQQLCEGLTLPLHFTHRNRVTEALSSPQRECMLHFIEPQYFTPAPTDEEQEREHSPTLAPGDK